MCSEDRRCRCNAFTRRQRSNEKGEPVLDSPCFASGAYVKAESGSARRGAVLSWPPSARRSCSEFTLQTPHQLLRIAGLALPDDHNKETQLAQHLDSVMVTLDVPVELRLPERSVAFRGRGEPASGMPMPKTAVNKDGPLPGAVREIRRASQVSVLDPVSVPESAHDLPNDELRLRPFLANARHPSRRLRIDLKVETVSSAGGESGRPLARRRLLAGPGQGAPR